MIASTYLFATMPQGRFDRVRFGVTAFGALFCLLPMIPLIIDPGGGPGPVVAIMSGAALVALIVWGHLRRGRMPIALVTLPVALALLIGIGLPDPGAATGVCLGIVASQTMYGSLRSIVLRLVGLMAVTPLSVMLSISTVGDTLVFSKAAAVAALPVIPFFTGMIYLLRNTMENQATTIAREEFMARLSSGLLASVTVQDIIQVMVQANRQLDQLSPGLITLYLVRIAPGEPGPPGGARILTAHGVEASFLPQYLPANALTELSPLGVEREVPLPAGSDLLTELGLPERKWHALALGHVPGVPCDLVLHGVQSSREHKLFGVLTPQEKEFLQVLRQIHRHWRLAMNRVDALDAVLEWKDRDHVTGLPDRSMTTHKINDLANDDQHQAGLILLDICGLDLVEAECGVAGADAAMVELTRRVTDLVGDVGFVGRNGDKSFAVALPSAEPKARLDELIARLTDSIHQPVLLPAGLVQLSPQISCAATNARTNADPLQPTVANLPQQKEQQEPWPPLNR